MTPSRPTQLLATAALGLLLAIPTYALAKKWQG